MTKDNAPTSPPYDTARDIGPLSNAPTILDPHDQAWKRLISNTVNLDELASLLETILFSENATDLVDCLQGHHVQVFIDALDTALDSLDLAPRIRREYMRLLHKVCARHTLVPRSLKIELSGDSPGALMYRGGFGDVWKYQYQGREIAVKVLRIYATSDLQIIARRFCKEFVPWKALHHPNVLPLLGVKMTENEFAMVSDWMSNGNINQFISAHQDANRYELLADVAKGLGYMHSRGMVHGDLKGANILVDQTSHARLADFGLLTTVSDSTTLISSTQDNCGTTRWMSPELLDTETQGNRRTKYSDRYALGMVIYEALSRHIPFYQYQNWSIPVKVAKGVRPERPREVEGVWFTDDVWGILERCWVTQPENRPSVEDVIRCLNQASRSWTRTSLQVAVPPTTDSPTTNPFEITDEQGMWVDEGEVPSPSHSLDDYDLPSKSDTDDNGIYPPAYKLPPPHQLTPHHHDDLHHSVSHDYNIPALGLSITKKALLIGISYRDGIERMGQKLKPISTSIPNVRVFEAFLKESYGYTDVTVMTDEDGVKERYQPTRENMKREIRTLRRGARPGDRHVFYFAGHSDQTPYMTDSDSEDGMGEVLVPLRGNRIKDNTLTNWLVKGLPKGSALTVIFDPCTSGQFLDLKHYKCNDSYRPWVNKGRRSSNLRNYIAGRRWGNPEPTLASLAELSGDLDEPLEKRTASPERCDGWCRTRSTSADFAEHADVISITSSNGGRIPWDSSTSLGDNISMTTCLIEILRKYPETTISELMNRLNHVAYSSTTEMLSRYQRKHRARRKAGGVADSVDADSEEEAEDEIDNFRDLKLGSMTPVDMNRPFIL